MNDKFNQRLHVACTVIAHGQLLSIFSYGEIVDFQHEIHQNIIQAL